MIFISLPLILCSCAQTISRPLPDNASGAMQLNAGYALLYKLMKEEAKVSEILKIKHSDAELARLLEDISKLSKEVVQKLDSYKAEDPSLKMDNEYLPAIETSARNSIKNATTVSLLLPGEKRFNELMSISQFSAMRYSHYLAISISTADNNIMRSKWLRQLATKLSKLQDRAFDLLALTNDVVPDSTTSVTKD